jgi:hypothetical protein
MGRGQGAGVAVSGDQMLVFEPGQNSDNQSKRLIAGCSP